MKTKLLFTAAAFMAATILLNAQEKYPVQKPQQTTSAEGGAFIDANNNGICDNFETGNKPGRVGRMNANAGSANIQGRNQGSSSGFGPGQGRGFRQRQGTGFEFRGRSFTDENNDGICDLRIMPPKK